MWFATTSANRLTRREWLAGIAAAGLARAQSAIAGSVLVHEHVIVDFIGADQIRPGRYDADEVFRAALPKLNQVKQLGCRRILECTPNFLGRDPRLLRRLQDASGVELWTNTGLYAAADHKYLPAFAKEETGEQLARRWTAEVRDGIDGVKPSFIKIGVNRGPLHEWDRKVVQAAAVVSRETGLTTASHTGNGTAALEQIEIFSAVRTSASKFVWVHAQNEKDHNFHRRAAQ